MTKAEKKKVETPEEIAGQLFTRIQNFRTNGEKANFAADLGKNPTDVIICVQKLLKLYDMRPISTMFIRGEWRIQEAE